VKLLVDACLSPAIAAALRDAGHDSVHVADIDMVCSSDEEILARANADERVVVSTDADFGALLAGSGAAGPSVVLLRSGDDLNPSQQAALLTTNLPQVSEDLERGAVVVLGRQRIRIRGLPIERSS
ncbi:MAG: DUF5615 family PIN-like protein, partial [Solirubrobacteraceae bacterium]